VDTGGGVGGGAAAGAERGGGSKVGDETGVADTTGDDFGAGAEIGDDTGTGEDTAAGALRSGGGAARGAESGGDEAIGSLGTGALSRATRGCAKRRLVTVGWIRSSTVFCEVCFSSCRLIRSTASGGTALMWFFTSECPTDWKSPTSVLWSIPRSRATS
jgi:hypothetical protein